MVERALPFRGEFEEPLDLEVLGAINRAGDGAPLLAALLRDPHLAALDDDLHLAQAIRDAREGRFDERAFLRRGHRAVAAYVRRAGRRLRSVFTRETSASVPLEQKVVCVASVLWSAWTRPTAPLHPSRQVQAIFGGLAHHVQLAPVRGARVLHADGQVVGRGRYGWRLRTAADANSRSAGTARPEFGRAVFVDDVDVDPVTGHVERARGRTHPGRVRTQFVVKGVGPTRYAGNRFSRRTSGVLTLLQGERDWRHSEALAQGGVPVYRPIELTLLPYCHWHPTMGWRPMVVYARLPLENLRVSDLEMLSVRRGRQVLSALRAKLGALADRPAGGIRDADLVRFFVARVGRIAGLCEAGGTFGGRPFFHGFLHPQNVSLLGELVDLGEGRFVESRRALGDAYAKSGYVNPARAWSAGVRHGRREAVPLHQIARRFARRVTQLMEPRPSRPPRGLDILFWHAHREGCAGRRADDAQELLDAIGARGGAA
jgi:hypothetical protein